MTSDEVLLAKTNECNELIEEYNTQNMIASVKELQKSGDIEGAMRKLANYSGDDNDAVQLKSQIEDEYEEEVIAFVKDSIESNEVDMAKKKLNDARLLIPNSESIEEWCSSIDEYYPVSLLSLNSFTNDEYGNFYDKGEWVSESDYDNVGNTDFFGNKYYVDDNREAWMTHTYLLDGKYNIFSGIWATSEKSKDKTAEKNWARFDVYGDGACLYTSPITRGGILPAEFSVDISNVNEFTIKLYGTGYLRFELLNPELRKTLSE